MVVTYDRKLKIISDDDQEDFEYFVNKFFKEHTGDIFGTQYEYNKNHFVAFIEYLDREEEKYDLSDLTSAILDKKFGYSEIGMRTWEDE